MSDEVIQIQMHTDCYFQGAEDNNGGMAAGLELARHYAKLPISQRQMLDVHVLGKEKSFQVTTALPQSRFHGPVRSSLLVQEYSRHRR